MLSLSYFARRTLVHHRQPSVRPTPTHNDSIFLAQLPVSLSLHNSSMPYYDHREANFGAPPSGGSLTAPLYYADSTFCKSPTHDVHGHSIAYHPSSPVQASLNRRVPFILMVNRGDCHFVQKVCRLPEKLGCLLMWNS